MPAVSAAGQTPSMPRKPAIAQTTQNGTSSEKNGSCRPTMAESLSLSIPVTPSSAMMGVPRAPNATGAVFAMSDKPAAESGLNPNCIRMAAVTATGVPNPAAPSKNAPNEKAISITWMRGSGAIPAKLFAESRRFNGEG